MAKNIVLCSDGTGNSGGKGRGTNVWRIFNAVDRNGHKWDAKIAQQIAYHDDGVGTQENLVWKTFSGAFGLGLTRNITQLYTFLVKNYAPGDQIYVFGFSRGAYTVRALAGLICRCGVIDHSKHSDLQIEDATKEAIRILRNSFRRGLFEIFRNDQRKTKLEQRVLTQAREFREKYAVKDHWPDNAASIRFVGVWDTVDAYGLPFDHLAKFWHDCIYPFRFPDRILNRQVVRASHAISIDDERHSFHPVLWDESGEDVSPSVDEIEEPTLETVDSDDVGVPTYAGSRINQVWFSGVHSNVGGGYPKDGMAMVTLDWMMSETEQTFVDTKGKKWPGLQFLQEERNRVRSATNVFDKLYNPRAGMASYYRYKPRNIEKICGENGIRQPQVHLGTLHRIKSGVEGYAPANLPPRTKVVSISARQPAAGESPVGLHRLTQRIQEQFACPIDQPRKIDEKIPPETTYESLKKLASPFILLRRLFHYILVAVTGLIVGIATIVRNGPEQANSKIVDMAASAGTSGLTSVPDGLYNFLIKPFFVYPELLALPLLMVAIWLAGRWSKNRVNSFYSRFWKDFFTAARLKGR